MSALSDPANLDLRRRPERDGDVRNEQWFRDLMPAVAEVDDANRAPDEPRPDAQDQPSQ